MLTRGRARAAADLQAMEAEVRAIHKDGLLWGAGADPRGAATRPVHGALLAPCWASPCQSWREGPLTD